MRDWCFRPDCLDRFVAAWPRAEVHRLADVGHWVVEDAPEESLAIVERVSRAKRKKLRTSTGHGDTDDRPGLRKSAVAS